MFIPPPNFKPQEKAKEALNGLLRLQASHLQIDKEIAASVFGAVHNALMVYYPQKNALMIAPATDELFKTVHKASQHLLKDRNAQGDKSIAIHEILIDHQLDDTDRELQYEIPPGLGILHVKL